MGKPISEQICPEGGGHPLLCFSFPALISLLGKTLELPWLFIIIRWFINYALGLVGNCFGSGGEHAKSMIS
jgi:hypothetical protein